MAVWGLGAHQLLAPHQRRPRGSTEPQQDDVPDDAQAPESPGSLVWPAEAGVASGALVLGLASQGRGLHRAVLVRACQGGGPAVPAAAPRFRYLCSFLQPSSHST